MRLAVLDLGSSSFHLTVFDANGGGLAARRELREVVRIGAGLTAAGRIDGETFARALAAIERLLAELEALEPGCPVVAVATSAIRDAANGGALVAEVGRRHRVVVEVLSGQDEARAAFRGARAHVGPAGRLVVADLGGGSLELASGLADECDVVASVPLGVLRLRDVHLVPERVLDVAMRDRVAAAVRFAAGQAARAVWDRRAETMALTSGTARALGALADELALRAPGSDELSCAALERMVQVMSQFLPVDLPALGVDQSRSDTIAIGAVVLHTLMQMCGFDRAVVSPFALREGIALRACEAAGRRSRLDRRSGGPMAL